MLITTAEQYGDEEYSITKEHGFESMDGGSVSDIGAVCASVTCF